MDKVLPPIVFLTALLTCFTVLVIAMTPTIEQNQRATWNDVVPRSSIDWQSDLFSNVSYRWWSPNPQPVSIANRITTWPVNMPADKKYTFTDTVDSKFPIRMWLVGKHFGDIGGDRHELYFLQIGGWAGAQSYGCTVGPNDWTMCSNKNGTINGAFQAVIPLRHHYNVFMTIPGFVDESSNVTQAMQKFYDYNFNISIASDISGGIHTDPWSIVTQMFTFSLQGVPTWINALIMAPIMICIGVVAYMIVRSVFPG